MATSGPQYQMIANEDGIEDPNPVRLFIKNALQLWRVNDNFGVNTPDQI